MNIKPIFSSDLHFKNVSLNKEAFVNVYMQRNVFWYGTPCFSRDNSIRSEQLVRSRNFAKPQYRICIKFKGYVA